MTTPKLQQCKDLLSITNTSFKMAIDDINKIVDMEKYTEITRVRMELIALEMKLKRLLN